MWTPIKVAQASSALRRREELTEAIKQLSPGTPICLEIRGTPWITLSCNWAGQGIRNLMREELAQVDAQLAELGVSLSD